MTSSHWIAVIAMMLLAAAVVCDLRSRISPDSISIALLTLAVIATVLRWNDVAWLALLGGFSAAFAIGAALFYSGAMGGGDAKLCAGLGALCGWPNVLEVLFATALCGGVLAYAAKRRGKETLPYAPAIAAGYVLTMAITWASPNTSGLWQWITEPSS
ncbi:MAG: A24 family peptidase [Planctomycetota bacterium]|nr:A24 family peptidase [Planctomycetota bacterium]